jgi:hypothetical protein
MDCTQFEEMVHDLDRPGTRGAGLREFALAHAEFCSHCGQLLTEAESLDMALQTIAARDGASEMPKAAEMVLLERFRQAKAASAGSRAAWRVAALGIAAAAVLAFGLALHRVAPKVKTQGLEQAGQTIRSVPSQEQSGGTATSAEQGDLDAMASFVPLPYADDPQGLEGGAVVRVQLSGPALASLGMPVAFAGSSESVSADLLVSDDGTPQAIRLISESDASQE